VVTLARSTSEVGDSVRSCNIEGDRARVGAAPMASCTVRMRLPAKAGLVRCALKWAPHVIATIYRKSPADPPGVCSVSCTCMDGTRRPDEWELRKPWLDEGESEKRRAKKAKLAVDRLAGQSFIMARGQVSKQHFLDPLVRGAPSSASASSAASAGGVAPPAIVAPKENQALARVATAARDALRVVFESTPAPEILAALEAGERQAVAASSGQSRSREFWNPLRAVLPSNSDYEPLRIEVDPSGTGTQETQDVLQSACNKVKLELFEGSLTLQLGAAAAARREPDCRAAATARLAQAIAELFTATADHHPRLLPASRVMLVEALSGIWDIGRSVRHLDVSLSDWLACISPKCSFAKTGNRVAACMNHV